MVEPLERACSTTTPSQGSEASSQTPTAWDRPAARAAVGTQTPPAQERGALESVSTQTADHEMEEAMPSG